MFSKQWNLNAKPFLLIFTPSLTPSCTTPSHLCIEQSKTLTSCLPPPLPPPPLPPPPLPPLPLPPPLIPPPLPPPPLPPSPHTPSTPTLLLTPPPLSPPPFPPPLLPPSPHTLPLHYHLPPHQHICVIWLGHAVMPGAVMATTIAWGLPFKVVTLANSKQHKIILFRHKGWGIFGMHNRPKAMQLDITQTQRPCICHMIHAAECVCMCV